MQQVLARMDAALQVDAARFAARIDERLLRLLTSLNSAMILITRWEAFVASQAAARQPRTGTTGRSKQHFTARPSLAQRTAASQSQRSQPQSQQSPLDVSGVPPSVLGMPYVFGEKEWVDLDPKPPLIGPEHQIREQALPSALTNDLAPLTTASDPEGDDARASRLSGERMCRWKPMPFPPGTAAAAAAAGAAGGAGADADADADADPVAAYLARLPEVSEEIALWVLYRSGWAFNLAEFRLREHLQQHRGHQPADLDEWGQEVPPLERMTPSDELLFAHAMSERPKDFFHAGRKIGKSTKCCVSYYYSTFKKKHKEMHAVRILACRLLYFVFCAEES